MAVPKRRTSRSKQGSRRSHHALKSTQLHYCSSCNEPVQPHRVCANCGYFQGRIALPPKDDTETTES